MYETAMGKLCKDKMPIPARNTIILLVMAAAINSGIRTFYSDLKKLTTQKADFLIRENTGATNK
jgi:hypothetical protein